jgi:hypothetical protein
MVTQAMQATDTASVQEYKYIDSVPAAAPAREQLPLVPLPPANLSYVLSPLYGRPSGVVKPWDDGATWDGETSHSLATPTPPTFSRPLLQEVKPCSTDSLLCGS